MASNGSGGMLKYGMVKQAPKKGAEQGPLTELYHQPSGRNKNMYETTKLTWVNG